MFLQNEDPLEVMLFLLTCPPLVWSNKYCPPLFLLTTTIPPHTIKVTISAAMMVHSTPATIAAVLLGELAVLGSSLDGGSVIDDDVDVGETIVDEVEPRTFLMPKTLVEPISIDWVLNVLFNPITGGVIDGVCETRLESILIGNDALVEGCTVVVGALIY